MNPTIDQQATGLQVFYNENENVSIRTEMQDGEPWFVAKDVATALDIDWSGKTLASIPEDWKGMGKFPIYASEGDVSGVRRMILINESAMYKLAFRSNKPEADRFVNWIAGSVLPSIRRTGSYSSDGVQIQIEEKKKLPLPKFRPGFAEWKEKVKLFLSANEAVAIAVKLNVSYSHVRKVYAGTAVSERVARALNDVARYNHEHLVIYPERRPVYEQLALGWEECEE